MSWRDYKNNIERKPCEGNGFCLQQCACDCYDEQTDQRLEICICGHREHNGYCPSNCCQLVKCKNYKNCKNKSPLFLLLDCRDLCHECDVKFGKHKTTDIVEECPVCFESKNVLILKCNHRICYDCWDKIVETHSKKYDQYRTELDDEWDGDEPMTFFRALWYNDDTSPICPLCRNENDWKNS